MDGPEATSSVESRSPYDICESALKPNRLCLNGHEEAVRYGGFVNAHRNEQPMGDALPTKLVDACRNVERSPLA